MPDFGKLRNNVYDGTSAMMPYTAAISCKMHSFDDNGNQKSKTKMIGLQSLENKSESLAKAGPLERAGIPAK